MSVYYLLIFTNNNSLSNRAPRGRGRESWLLIKHTKTCLKNPFNSDKDHNKVLEPNSNLANICKAIHKAGALRTGALAQRPHDKTINQN